MSNNHMKQVNEVDITVETQYLKNQILDEGKYAFAYRITYPVIIVNSSVQLINRYWLITDGDGTNNRSARCGRYR